MSARTMIGSFSALLILGSLCTAPAQTFESGSSVSMASAGSVEETGEDASPQETTNPQGERVFKDRIVVTASRREQESADTLAPITVFDREDIEREQPEKLADLLKQAPGVEIAGEGPFRGIPVIRGFSSNRLLILVDGQRLNNARESTEFAGIQPGLVDLADVERIEVLRGPASVMYGSDALGGVINIITRQPDLGNETFSWGGEAGVEYADATSSERARLALTGQGKGFALRLGASYQDADNYESPEGEVPNSGMKQHSFDASLRLLTGERGTLRVSLESVRTDDIGFPGYDPATSGVDIAFPNFDRDKASVAWEIGPIAGMDTVSLSTYYQKTSKESRRNLAFGPFFSNNYTVSDIDAFGLNARMMRTVASHQLSFGVDFYRDEVHDETIAESNFGSSSEVSVPDSYQQGLGAYLQDDVQIADRVKIVAGVRGDTYAFKSEEDVDYTGEPFDVTDSAVSGNLGLIYEVTDNVNVSALVGRGFRSPNLQERSFFGLASTGDTYIQQNPNLDSESSLNYEVGFKARYDRYFGGMSVFYNDVSDLISLRFLGIDPITGLDQARFENIDQATIRGVELELETIFFDRWTAFQTVSYTRGDNETEDQPLDFIPPLKVILGLRYQTQRWWTEGAIRIVDRRDRVSDPALESSGFTVYDLRGGYRLSDGLRLRATLANLTDKAYSEPFNNRLEPGRNLRLSLTYSF